MPVSRATRLAVADVFLTRKGGAEAIARRRKRRLPAMVQWARTRSPFYRELYTGLPADLPGVIGARGVRGLSALPVVTKPELMERFDDVVTDRAVTRRGVDEFLADPGNIGRPFLGRYQAATSSGTTGHPGVFVQDEMARVLGGAFTRIRGSLTNWAGLPGVLRFARGGRRYALVDVGGGPYGALVSFQWALREDPRLADTMRFISVLDPVQQQVEELNAFQPGALGGYPSAIMLLAREQSAGRLHIEPVFIVLVGENVTEATRRLIEDSFGCRTFEEYGSTENGVMAVQCREHWLHYNADWYVLEPVDARNLPVPAGRRSHTVLVTNLTNRLMPFLRYDQGDGVLLKPDPCACGNAFPAIRVTGRTDDLLVLPSAQGDGTVSLPPLGLVTVIEETPGVQRLQVVQLAAGRLEVRLQPLPGVDPEAVWPAVTSRVRAYFDTQGAGAVELRRSAEPPMQNPRSGKYAQVIKKPG